MEQTHPLDLARTGYSYIERPNTAILDLLARHAPGSSVRILDVGCGAGANARAIRGLRPNAFIQGVEPNARAAELAREVCSQVFHGMLADWLATKPSDRFDALILSDVLEHIPDPVAFLKELSSYDGLRDAVWIISVPNYAVWYNRIFTLLGRFEYAWSGLYDRTHLRFFTRDSVTRLLEYVDLTPVEVRSTPSLVQSAAPILRSLFERDVKQGDHRVLERSKAYQLYERVVEPAERVVCGLWPELLGFQVVVAARTRS